MNTAADIASSPPPAQLSPARSRLAEHQARLARARDRLSEAQRSADRLRAHADATADDLKAANAALAGIDQAHIERVRRWGGSHDTGPAPAQPVAERATAAARADLARQTADLARATLSEAAPAAAEAGRLLADLELATETLILAILEEEHARNCETVKLARAALLAAESRAYGLMQLVGDRSHSLREAGAPDPIWRPWSQRREAMPAELNGLGEAAPTNADVAAAKGAWLAYAARLAADATAQLEPAAP